jgi:hypothetical protein
MLERFVLRGVQSRLLFAAEIVTGLSYVLFLHQSQVNQERRLRQFLFNPANWNFQDGK